MRRTFIHCFVICCIERFFLACLFMVFTCSLAAVPVGIEEGSVSTSAGSKKEARFYQKKTAGAKKELSSMNKKSLKSGKSKKSRRPKKTKKAKAKKEEDNDIFYDITADESVAVLEEKVFPESTLLAARERIEAFLAEAQRIAPEDIDSFLDELYAYHYEGRAGVQYTGIVGLFLLTIRSGIDLLTLTTTSLEEGSVSLSAFNAFILEIQNLRLKLAAEMDARWDRIIFRMEALEAHAQELRLRNVLNFQEALGLVHHLNHRFIDYLEQVLRSGVLTLQDEPLLEQQERAFTAEEPYYLPQGLLDLDDEPPPVLELPGLAQVQALLENALQPVAFVGARLVGRSF